MHSAHPSADARKRRLRSVPSAPQAADSTGASLARVPVLIVEDDQSNAKLMAVVLRGEGCDVRIAGSAEEALTVLQSFRPRAMVLDLVLPLMGGLALAQVLKADPATREIVLIAVSAFNGRDAERSALQAGCAAYVRKPIDAMSFSRFLLSHIGGLE